MKVFISWSGTPSRELAEALHWWLPKVIQGTEPFVSAKDIDKGANWTHVLSEELRDTDFGIVCLTPENRASPWLNYEAGAITKSVESRVCPLLLGVTKDDVSGPLRQLQITSLELNDVLLMLRSLNKTSGSPLTDGDLEEAARMWWPRLEERVSAIDIPPSVDLLVNAPEPAKPQSSESEILSEILDRVRRLDRRLMNLERSRADRRSEVPDANWQSEPMWALRDEGVIVTELQRFADHIELRGEAIPGTLPGKSWSILSGLSRSRELPVILKDDSGRFIEFRPDGSASEPPF